MTTKDLIAGFMTLSTPTVSDAMDKLQIKCGCEGMMPITLGKKFVGPAFTVRYAPKDLTPPNVGDFIDDVKEGEVVVIDNRGRTDCTVWGDIMTCLAVSKKIAGTVIDGVCRDVDGIRELGYPMFTRGHFMVTGKDRVTLEAVNEKVVICGVRVAPGDLIMGDQTGVLVIPRERAEEILRLALKIEEAENGIIEAIKGGSSLKDARKKFNYHKLQTPDKAAD